MARDADIDRLYQLPLAEFTAARNALAKARGRDGAGVKALVKPSLPAWAVNQLYWQRPKVYAALTSAADAVRAAHARVLSGRSGDVAGAETTHAAAVREAADGVRALLGEAGESATPATMTAVVETLQALPAEGEPGRLTRALKPRGLEALAGLVPKLPSSFRAAAAATAAPSARASKDAAAGAKRAAAEARRAEQARKRERAAIERDLKKARKAEREAAAALKDARRQLAQAERRHEQLRDQLQFAMKQIQDHRDDIARLDQRRRETEGERERLDARLATLAAGD